MEEKKEHFCQSGRNNNANENLFTAGILLLMVCLKITLLLFLVEQWRAWVFLVLNIVLLAIFFTSSSTSTQSQESKGEMKKRGNCRLPIDEVLEAKKRRNESSDIDEEKVEEKVVEKINEGHDPLKLSKEELNERVEAFIAMFRQQLASDARKGRETSKLYADRKQADMKKHIKLSSHGVNCFVLKVQG
ncbi:hypothetical protein COLO4_36996 [Corchorus olitorius]|uniref:Uncharacterized protein n=1 Tax=Corchorus olitorius TaxID=93759 RepID=A0A1R3G3U1_9ROSI|nr:hypothetical protein COLO4_36996 [Corchorus olitorius]